MAQEFKRIPRWVVGIAKMLRAGLVLATSNEIISARPYTAIYLMIAREMIGEFINQAEIKPKNAA